MTPRGIDARMERRAEGVADRGSGQSVAELALILPALILMLAAVDFARLYYMWMAVTDAARAGAQYGAQNRTTAVDLAGMEQAACDAMQDLPCAPGTNAVASNFCHCSGAPISCTSAGSCAGYVQNFVQVTANATFDTVIAYPGIPSSVPISASVVMQVQ